MYCEKCGKPNADGAAFCSGCGNPLQSESFVQPPTENNYVPPYSSWQGTGINTAPKTVSLDKRKVLGIVSFVLSCLMIILPFCTWADVPVADTLYSYLGGTSSISSYSLFSYVFTGSSSGVVGIILLISLIVAIVGMILNLIYIIKFFMKKEKAATAIVAAILMLLTSLVFAISLALTSAVTAGMVNVTFVVWLMIISAIVNIVVVAIRKRA